MYNILHTASSIVTLLYVAWSLLLAQFWYKLKRNLCNNESISFEETSVEGEVIIVTGASRGIGKAVALEFSKRGATVIMGCVDLEEGNKAKEQLVRESGNEDVRILHLDLSDMDSVASFAINIRKTFPKIKVLVNNAGIGAVCMGDMKTKQGFNIQMAVNHLGHFLLTNLLIDCLKEGAPSRVISISSSMMLCSQLETTDLMMKKSGFGLAGGLPYANSKHANALFIKELSKRLKGTGITAYSLCPGGVRTAIYNQGPLIMKLNADLFLYLLGFTTEEAATEFIIPCAISKSETYSSGRMHRFNKEFKTANAKLNDDICSDLWNISSELVQLQERIGDLYSLS